MENELTIWIDDNQVTVGPAYGNFLDMFHAEISLVCAWKMEDAFEMEWIVRGVMLVSVDKDNDFLHYMINFVTEKLTGWMKDLLGPIGGAITEIGSFLFGAKDKLSGLNEELAVVNDAMAVVGGLFSFGGSKKDGAEPEPPALDITPSEKVSQPAAGATPKPDGAATPDKETLNAKPTPDGEKPSSPPSKEQVDNAKKQAEAKKILENSRPPEVIEKDIDDTQKEIGEKEEELTTLEEKEKNITTTHDEAKEAPDTLVSIEAKFQALVSTAKGGEVEMEITAIIKGDTDNPVHGKVAFNFGNPIAGAMSFFTSAASQMTSLVGSLAGF